MQKEVAKIIFVGKISVISMTFQHGKQPEIFQIEIRRVGTELALQIADVFALKSQSLYAIHAVERHRGKAYLLSKRLREIDAQICDACFSEN